MTLKAQLEIAADASGVEAGVTTAKRSLAGLGQAAADAGKQAAAGLDGIGQGGDASAKRVEQATKSIIGSIQRTTALVEAGKKSNAEYFRSLAEQRGVDPATLKPYLDQLDAVVAKQRAAAQALGSSVPVVDQLGTSAKQTAWAMRGIPAQMTDIVVSLQSGQKPLTVLMQQGGQLKDMFGGVGNAARAVGAYVLGMVNPFTLAAAAAAGLGAVYYLGAKESDAYTKAIIGSGNAAGATVGKMQAAAASVAKLTGATQGAAAEAIAALAGTGNVAARDFERFASVAVKVQRETGTAVSETVKQFAELGKDPLQASIKLNEQTHYLTLSVYEQIKALTEQGRAADAAAAAQNAFASAMEGRTGQLHSNLGLIEKAWRYVADEANGAWSAMLGIGRKSTIEQQISEQQAILAKRQANPPLLGGLVGQKFDADNEAIRQRIALLGEMARMEKRGAEATAEAVSQVQARVQWDKEGEKFLSKQAQLERDIAKARNEGIAAGVSQAAIEKRIAEIREKSATKVPKKAVELDPWQKEVLTTYAKSLEDLGRVQLEASSKADGLSKAQEKLRGVIASPAWEAFNRQQKEQVIYAASLAQGEEDRASAVKATADAMKKATDEHAKYITELNRSADTVGDHVQKLRDEEAALSIAAQQNISLARAIELVQIARLQEAQAEQLSYGNDLAAQALQREIDKRRELMGLLANKEARDEWRSMWASIDSTAHDVFVNIFEGGQSAFKKLGAVLKSSLLDLLYQMTVKKWIMSISASVGTGSSFAGAVMGDMQGNGGLLGNTIGLAANGSALGNLGSTVGGWFSGTSAAMAAANAATATGGSLAGAAYTTAAADSALAYGAAGTTAGMTGGAAASTGITSALAAVPVWGWIALAAIAIASKAKGETRSGGQYAYDSNTGVAALLQGPSGGEIEGDLVRKSIAGTVGGLNFLLKGLGSQATITGAQAGVESSDRGRGGVFFGGTLSTGKTFGESGKGSNYEGTLYEMTSSHSVDAKTALENFTTDLLQGTIQALQAASDIPTTIADKLRGVDAESLTKEAATALVNDITTLVTNVNNFRAAIEGMPFEQLKSLSFDAASSLIAVAGGMDKLGNSLSSYYDNFYTAEEKRSATIEAINKALAGTGFDAATATRAQFRQLVESQDLTTDAGRKMYATLLGISGAFVTVTEAVDSATTALQDSAAKLRDLAATAFDGLDRAVSAQKDALTAAYEAQAADIATQIDVVSASVGKLQGLSSTLKATLDGMRLSGSEGAYRQAAQAQISAALATARAGGPLPLDGQLDSALRTVSQPSEQLFRTFQDYARDFYRTANDISSLSDITGTQLTSEQLTLKLLTETRDNAKAAYDKETKRLDSILATAKLQLDTLNGIDTSVKSVVDALDAFNTVAGTPKPTTGSGAASSAGGGVVVGGGVATGAPAETGGGFWESINLMGTPTKHYIDDPAKVSELTKLRDYINATFDGSRQSLEKIKAMGGSQAQIAMASGYYLADIRKLYEGVGIPAFARGGTFAGGLRIVGESGPELEATGASRIWNSGQLASALASGGASNAELASELRASNERVQALLESIARNTKETSSTMLAVTHGGDTLRTEAV